MSRFAASGGNVLAEVPQPGCRLDHPAGSLRADPVMRSRRLVRPAPIVRQPKRSATAAVVGPGIEPLANLCPATRNRRRRVRLDAAPSVQPDPMGDGDN